jgi:hypothetical protein
MAGWRYKAEGEQDMATEILFLVEEAPEGGYLAQAVGYCICTEADTWEELREAVRDAVLCHFDDGAQPQIIRLRGAREEVLAA